MLQELIATDRAGRPPCSQERILKRIDFRERLEIERRAGIGVVDDRVVVPTAFVLRDKIENDIRAGIGIFIGAHPNCSVSSGVFSASWRCFANSAIRVWIVSASSACWMRTAGSGLPAADPPSGT